MWKFSCITIWALNALRYFCEVVAVSFSSCSAFTMFSFWYCHINTLTLIYNVNNILVQGGFVNYELKLQHIRAIGYNASQTSFGGDNEIMKYLKLATIVLFVLVLFACALTSVPVMLSAVNGQQPELRPKVDGNLDLVELRQTYIFLGFTASDTRCGPYPSWCSTQVFYSIQLGWNDYDGPNIFLKYQGFSLFAARKAVVPEYDPNFPVHKR